MTQVTARPKFRAHDWVSTKTLQPCFAIQAAVGKNGWQTVSTSSGKPILFKTAAERDAELREMLS